jgi:RNA polymerase sigma-70 factor (ECF subfamily)
MPDPPFDVAACLRGVARGDEAAARALIAHCHPLVARLVRAHRPRALGVDDLAQEVYLKLFRVLHRYEPRPGVPFEHWLSRLTVRTCIDALRVERRQPLARAVSLSAEAGAWLLGLGGGAEPPVDDALAAREALDALLLRLEPADRLLLTLLDVEERSVAEVASLTGWSRANVRVRAFRARRRLRSAAADLGGR